MFGYKVNHNLEHERLLRKIRRLEAQIHNLEGFLGIHIDVGWREEEGKGVEIGIPGRIYKYDKLVSATEDKVVEG